jgi:hypothetical protein
MPKTIIVHFLETFGRLHILREVERGKAGQRRAECICDCGNVVTVTVNNLRMGGSTSCHPNKHRRKKPPTVVTHPAERRALLSIIQRCCNPNHKAYDRYGGRGITVCKEWKNSFDSFFSYVGPRPSPVHSIDRWPDNDGNYEPGNVRWANRSEQNRNKRDNVWIDHKGERRLLIEVAEEAGIPYYIAMQRRDAKWPDEKLFMAVRQKRSVGCTTTTRLP